MLEMVSKRVEALHLEEINARDRTFAISPPWWPVDLLVESVRRVGILSPLLIQSHGGEKQRVISGFRRYEAARRLGLLVVPCLISPNSGNPTQVFLQALLDNLAARPLHPLEKAIALVKLSSEFLVTQREIVEEFLPLLAIRPDRFHLQHYLSLGRLSERLQRSVADSLEPNVALKLASWKEEEQTFFLSLVRKYELGKNRQKELVALLDELRAEQTGRTKLRVSQLRSEIDSKPGTRTSELAKIWKESGAAQVAEDEQFSQAERFKEILTRLRRRRFPCLAQYQQRYKELRAALRIPPGIQFQVPPFFEGDRITLTLRFRHPDELRTLAGKLGEMAHKKELEEIFQLL